MSEELYNSNDYCSLAEENEELKKENAELLADKLHLIGAAMDGGDKYHYAAHDIGYRDMERKVKALEADYVISNRELLILQQRIAELEAAQRWIPVGERLPDNWESVLTIDISKSTQDVVSAFYNPETSLWSTHFSCDLWVTHWMPLPESPIVYGKVCEE